MRMKTRGHRAAIVSLAFVIVGRTADAQITSTPSTSPSGPRKATVRLSNLPEAQFVPLMLAHHRDGIAIARYEETNGASSTVQALAGRLRERQERDLAELQRYLTGAAASEAAGTATPRQLIAGQREARMASFTTKAGADLDRAFLEEMLTRHQIASEMAERAKIENPAIKKLIQRMIAGQRRETIELKTVLSTFGMPT